LVTAIRVLIFALGILIGGATFGNRERYNPEIMGFWMMLTFVAIYSEAIIATLKINKQARKQVVEQQSRRNQQSG
jgi:hypothetical protein